MTGIEADLDFTLEECGLASIGLAQLVGMLNKRFSHTTLHLHISVVDMQDVETIAEVAAVVAAAKEAATLASADAM